MDPWTADELSGAEGQFAQFLQSHPGYGDTSDGLRYYQNLRQQGQSHDQALSAAFSQLGWTQPAAPTTPTTPTTPAAPPPSGPAAPSDYDFNQARANIEKGIGRPLSDADVATAFQRFGGNQQSRFTDAGIAPVISYFKGAGQATPPPAGPAGPPAGPSTATVPTWNGAAYTPPPAYQPPPAFSYEDFKAPTPESVLNDPAYQFELGQGTKSLERSAAAKGVTNTGGTLKDLISYGQDLASTKYGEAYDRGLSTYATNRSNALNTYNTNYQTQYQDPWSANYKSQYADPFAFNFQNNTAQYGASQHNYDLGLSAQQHNYDQDLATRQHTEDQNKYYDFNTWLQSYNMKRNDKNDAFDQRYKVLGLF